ncbi:MAG TPA: KipI antagonist, partial [Clostridia bacterium]|nr:KipI antagonist [Clostridia bacterium]
GNPIIMLADCQTTGGYTKIAHVITTDLWKVAQLKTGDTIRFEAIDISDAHEIFRKREQKILEMIEGFSHKRLKDDKDFRLNINSQSFEVKINEVSSLK